MASRSSVASIGIIGTSWWVDSMYLPALSGLDGVDVVAIAGRDPERARSRAAQWDIPAVYTDWRRMLDDADLTGVIVAAANPVHYPATRAILERGLDVLCEKPVADTAGEAGELARMAKAAGAVTMVPFTYAFMPGFRYLERLVSDGYVGRIHHVGLRYHAGYGIDSGYLWKLDARKNPTGALGDIGSHFLYLALRLAGDVSAVTARLESVGRHPDLDPDGNPYPAAADSSVVILEFASGAQGILHASSVAYEGTSMNQRHEMEVHGEEGTVKYVCDWDFVQEVSGSRVGEGPPRPMPIPDDIWGPVRRSSVHDTYRDVFRKTDAMARGWAQALTTRVPVRPDLADGAAVQALLDASLESSASGRRREMKATS